MAAAVGGSAPHCLKSPSSPHWEKLRQALLMELTSTALLMHALCSSKTATMGLCDVIARSNSRTALGRVK